MTEERNNRRGNNNSTNNHTQRQNAGARDAGSAQNRTKVGKNQTNANNSTPPNKQSDPQATPTPPTASVPLQEEEHIPIKGFNAAEVDALMKRGFDPKAPIYKPDDKVAQGKSGSPWGTKPGSMASGRDFWLELRKQTTALQQNGGSNQGSQIEVEGKGG